jgi:hypothetical protein
MAIFADAVQVTFDRADWRAMRLLLLPLLDDMGCETRVDCPADEAGLWRSPSGGSLKAERFGSVVALGASGQFLAMLRASGFLHTYLATLSTVPHKVTRLDATMDLEIDAPPVLHRLVKRARSADGVSLTRKRVPAAHVTTLLSPRLDGRLSGTAYMGSKTAPVRLCVYDKQKERVDAGVLDAPPCLRYELRLRNGLATLRDASDPTAIFWHHMRGVLRVPAGVPAWSPALDVFSPERVVPDPAYRLRRRVAHSPDLAALVKLADSLPGGRAALYREIGYAYPVHAETIAA